MEEKPLPQRAESSVVVNAAAPEVFRLLEDPHALMKWVTFLRQVQWAKGSGVGARDRCQLEIAGMKVWMGAQVHLYEKNSRIGRRSVEGMPMRSEVQLTPIEARTRVDWTISYRPPMGPLGALMNALVMGKSMREGMSKSLAQLKGLAESGYQPIPHVGVDELRESIARGTPPVLVDVRDPEDFAGKQGGIPGSINIPMEQFPSRIGELAKFREKEVVTVCYAGRMAGDAAELLLEKGFPRAKVLLGGLSSWNATAGRG